MASRQVNEGRQIQGVDEKVVYSITTTPWGSGPINVSVTVKDVTANLLDVTASVTTGSPSVSGDVVTLPKIQSLTVRHLYRVEVKFDVQGNTLEPYFEIQAEL